MTEAGPARKSAGSGNQLLVSGPIEVGISVGGRSQGRTTRSSRWTTSWGSPSAELRRLAARDPPQRRRRSSATRPLANGAPVVVDDLDRVVGVERALDAADAGGEQRAVVAAHSARRAPSSTTTRPAGAAGERDPQLAARQALGSRPDAVPTGAPGDRVDDHRRARRRRRSPRARPTTPRSWPPRACWPCRRSRAPCPCRRRRASSAASTSTISSMSDACVVERGDRR